MRREGESARGWGDTNVPSGFNDDCANALEASLPAKTLYDPSGPYALLPLTSKTVPCVGYREYAAVSSNELKSADAMCIP